MERKPFGEKAPTGIGKLDEIIGGGFPTNSNIILLGPPMIGKNILALQYLYRNLQNGRGAIQISTNKTVEEVKERMKSFGWDTEKHEKESFLKFIDCYSKMIGKPTTPRNSVTFIPSVLDLTKITVTISQLCSEFWKRELKICLVFDSISSLLTYSNLPAIMRFLHVFTGRLRMVGATSLFIVEEGMHDQRTIASLEQLTEGLIHMASDEKGRYIKIESLMGARYKEKIYYELTSSGLTLV